MQLYPKLDNSLCHSRRGDIYLSVLNRLYSERTPLWREEPIVQVYVGGADEFIAEEIIIIVSVNSNWCGAREADFEVKVLVDLWIRHINLVVFSLVILFLTTLQKQVRVRGRTNISLSKIEAFKDIHSCEALSLLLHKSAHHVLVLRLHQESDYLEMATTHLLEHLKKFILAFGSLQVVDITNEIAAKSLIMDLVEDSHNLILLTFLANEKFVLFIRVADFHNSLKGSHLLHG